MLLALPAGRYAERHGLHRPVVLSSAVATAGGLCSVAWPHFGVLCLTALSSGAAVCLTMIALQRHVGHMARDATELRQVFSWVTIGPSIANFLGPFLAGLWVDGSGFRAAYLFLALRLSLWLGLALGSVQPMVMSTLHQITPKQRHGEALGLRSMAINGSRVVMPLLFGSARVLVGVGGVFWVVGVVVGGGSALAWRMRGPGRLPAPPPQRLP